MSITADEKLTEVMPLGSYRLSADEQKTETQQATQAARVLRIVEVRKQDKVIAAQRRQNYKLAAEKAELVLRKEAETEWKRVRQICQKRLVEQQRNEVQGIGTAQKHAKTAMLAEISNQQRKAKQEVINEEIKHQRFKEALSASRRDEKMKRRQLLRLVVRRSTEKENSRILARRHAKVASNPLNNNTRQQNVSSFPESKNCCAAIDYKFSRMHDLLGIAAVPIKEDSKEQLTAHDQAMLETKKLQYSKLQRQKQKEIEELRARDRGEIALLREQAIIQKQFNENYLEKQDQAEKKMKKIHLEDRARAIIRSHRRTNMEDAERSVEKILFSNVSEQQIKDLDKKTPVESQTGSSLKTSVAVYTKKDSGIQTDAVSIRKKVEHVLTSPIGSILESKTPAASTTQEDERSQQTLSTCESSVTKPVESSIVQVDAAIQTLNIIEEQTNNDKQELVPACRKESNQQTVLTSDCYEGPYSIFCIVEPETNTLSNALPTSSEELWSEQSFNCEASSESVDKTVYKSYEDSLSEALSLETDVFMEQYLQGVPPDALPDVSTVSSSESFFDHLTSLLGSSELDDHSTRSGSSLSHKSSLSVPSLGVESELSTIHEDAFEMSGFTENSSSSLTGDRGRSECSRLGMTRLVRELDKMSEDSIYLLSGLSDFLVSTSQHKGSRLSLGTNCPLSTSTPSLNSQSLGEKSKSSKFESSLLLNTISEEEVSSDYFSEIKRSIVERKPSRSKHDQRRRLSFDISASETD